MTSCCKTIRQVETIWLWRGSTRKQLGTVVVCGKCGRQCGKLELDELDRPLRMEEWMVMENARKAPPFYFVERDGRFVPE